MRARRSLCVALVGLWIATNAAAQGIERTDYDALAQQLNGLLDLEHAARLPEPGQPISGLLRRPGITVGEHFSGHSSQPETTTDGIRVEALTGHVTAPLIARPGGPLTNLAISHHNGFGSNALWGIGEDPFPALSGLGEGAIAIAFDVPQQAFGFRIHADYPDPLGTRPRPGTLIVWIYDMNGQRLAQHRAQLDTGPISIAYETTDGAPRIGGAALIPADPGGVAFDDFIFYVPDVIG